MQDREYRLVAMRSDPNNDSTTATKMRWHKAAAQAQYSLARVLREVREGKL